MKYRKKPVVIEAVEWTGYNRDEVLALVAARDAPSREGGMKALSLWQPWASAIALGAKRIETRDWATAYRGPLAIHAAKRCVKGELAEMGADPTWRGALDRPGNDGPLTDLPFGAIVAVCRLVDCLRTDDIDREMLLEDRHPAWGGAGGELYDWSEWDMGNFGPHRFGWVLEDMRAVGPIPWRGAQGLFEIPDGVIEGRAG